MCVCAGHTIERTHVMISGGLETLADMIISRVKWFMRVLQEKWFLGRIPAI